MYFGWATAIEAAAVGVIGALGLAAAASPTMETFFTSSRATRTSAMIALILMGASFVAVDGLYRLPRALAGWIDGMICRPSS